jgi:hypothetical protein
MGLVLNLSNKRNYGTFGTCDANMSLNEISSMEHILPYSHKIIKAWFESKFSFRLFEEN